MMQHSVSFSHLYKESLCLMTDLYQLMMAYGYWQQGMTQKEAVFYLSFRNPPFHGGFTVAAGLEYVIDFMEHFRFHDSDLEYLATLKGADHKRYFPDEFLIYLRNLKFTCDVDAVPEGTVIFPQEPLIRVQGPLIQCQLLESPILNLINFSTLIATKAARVCIAANGDPVLEFGMRRAQGIDGALTATRASYIGGCDATSNVLAGKLYGIPVRGTHAHSWVMAFEDELSSFEAFAEALPGNCVFLVDTYNTIEGTKKAIQVGKILDEHKKPFLGVRLDSGDLAYLSIVCRQMLDEAGFHHAKIYASNELDETLITELKRQGAQIGVWGVGTKLVTGKEQAALDGVYKLSAIRDPDGPWEWKLKLSEQLLKISNPGILQVRRFVSDKGNVADVIYDIHTELDEGCSFVDVLDPTKEKVMKKGWQSYDLLKPILRKGKKVYDLPALSDIRSSTIENLEQFPDSIKRFLNPHQYIVGMEVSLYKAKVDLIRQIRQKMFSQSL